MAWIAPRNWVVNEPINSWKLDEISSSLQALRDGITCSAYKTTQPAIAHNAWTTVSFELNSWDNLGIHAAGTDRFVAPFDGVYTFTGEQLFRDPVPGGPAFATNEGMRIIINGGPGPISETITWTPGGLDWSLQITRDWKVVAGSYFGLQVWQGSGSPLPLLACTASLKFVGTGL